MWNLNAATPPVTLGGFAFHAFADGHFWTIPNPTPQQFQAARKSGYVQVGSVLDLDLASGVGKELPLPDKSGFTSMAGGEELVRDYTSTHHPVLEIRDPATGRILWQRAFPVEHPPFVFPMLDGGGWTLVYATEWDFAKEGLQHDPAAQLRLRSQGKTGVGAWLEEVDPQTGSSRRQWLLDPAPTLASNFQLGSDFYLADGAHRLLDYAVPSGELKQVWFGDPLAASTATTSFAMKTGARTLALFSAGAATPRQQYQFPQDLVFAQFSSDGRRLLALTRDQTVYLLAVPPPA